MLPVTRNWVPILESDHRRRALEVLGHIAQTIDETVIEEPGLGNGATGVALFLTYRSAYEAGLGSDPRSSRERAASLLRSAAAAVLSTIDALSFLHGLSGVAWAIDHLRLHHGLDVEGVPRDILDRKLFDRLSEKPWCGVYELGHGLVGYGLYAAEDCDAPGRRRMLGRVVDQLAATALPSGHGGVTWWTAPQSLGAAQRKEAPLGHFNIGLAHGIPSIIAILGLACALHVGEQKARELAEKALRWLHAQQQPQGSGSYFGTTIPLGARPPLRASRVAWCFGDLGISASLYWAAANLHDSTTATRMLNIARKTARREPLTCQVKEASVCHGAAGNAHIFNRFYQATRESVFREASLYWFERIFDYYNSRVVAPLKLASTQAPSSSDVLKAKQPPVYRGRTPGLSIEANRITGYDASGWTDQPGFFGGLAGIGLTLLAGMTTVEPAWDRMLLVSMPAAPRP